MKRIFLLMGAIMIFSLVGCKQNQQSATPAPAANNDAAVTAPASPTTGSPAVATAPTTAPSLAPGAAPVASMPAVAALPPNANKNAKGKDGKTPQQNFPPGVWERLTRPLSLEEINKLPPETRDMILKAQGRYPGPKSGMPPPPPPPPPKK